VAIKIPRPDRISTPQRIEQFMEEARRLAQLKHPGIVPIYDVGHDERFCFIVSDLIEGKNLAETIAGNRPSPPNAARLLAQIADSLHYAHQQGFVHRDVKPSNILLGHGASAFLTDFGIAASVDELAGANHQGIGTLAYMSPEQLRGEAMDHRTDIYSLGIVMFELLTGELPPRASSPLELQERTVASDSPSPRQVNSSVSPELDAVCIKSIAADPSERYQSAAELADALRKATSPKSWSLWPILVAVASLSILLVVVGRWAIQRETEAANEETKATIEKGRAVLDEVSTELRKTFPPPVVEKPATAAPPKPAFDLSFTKSSFDLSGQDLSDEDFARLGKHVTLSSLNLAETKTTDAQLAALQSALGLRMLNLSGTPITDEGLQHLGSLPSLQRLTLDKTSVTNKGMTIIGKMRLRQLSLARTSITDDGVASLVDQYGVGGNLRELDLSNTSITDGSVPSLRSIRRLERINLQGTSVTEQGVEELKSTLPKCEVLR
jgi:serine/threonine protein kinase